MNDANFHEEYLKTNFPHWDVVNLSYPLRTSKNLSEKILSNCLNNPLTLGPHHDNAFNTSLNVTLNIPLGPKPLLLSTGSTEANFKYALTKVVKDKKALIIVEVHPLNPFHK